MCESCKCFISLMHVNNSKYFKPIGMLHNAVLLQRQNTMIESN